MHESEESKNAEKLEHQEQPETIYRYPGVTSFGTEAIYQNLFFGRDKECSDLFQLIRSNRLTVVYGKSGLGKTSLLQAGIFPRLREINLLPLRVRLNEQNKTPMEILEQEIQSEFERERKLSSLLEMNYRPTDSWWEFFKTSVFWRGDRLQKPVLVLDQFEEIFKLHDRTSREAIAEQLSYLVNSLVPPTVRDQLRNGERAYSESPPDVHVVLSLRIENVGQLQELFSQIPGILNQRFILLPMEREQALDAIVKPAEQEPRNYKTKPFRYHPSALNLLLDHLTDEDSNSVEPYQLQLQCHHIERQVEQIQRSQQGVIEVDDKILGSKEALSRVVTDYYIDTIQKFGDDVRLRLADDTSFLKRLISRSPKRLQRRARRLCENGLLVGDGDRVPLSEVQITSEYMLTSEDLEFLVQRRLLRKEKKLKTYTYELSHDSLVQPILSKRRYLMSNQVKFGLFASAIVIAIGVSTIVELLRREALHALDETQTYIDVAETQINDLLLRLNSNLSAPKMQMIPAGSDQLGSDAGNPDELLVSTVIFPKAFALSRYEVTLEQYDIYALATRKPLPNDEGWGRGNRPAINTSWLDAQGYIQWLNEQTSGGYRLPTEAEWEYAARAGSSESYSWGSKIGNNLANCRGCGSDWDNRQTAPVGSFEANDFGLYDMHGNVWEWVQDCYADNDDVLRNSNSSPASSSCANRVRRGGSWGIFPESLRSSARDAEEPNARSYSLGFRLAQDIETMVEIPAGSFQMGSSEGGTNERPAHIVTIAQPFFLSRYEVTFSEYDEYAEESGVEKPADEGWGRGNRPVINVSWEDALGYIRWLNERTGNQYRLPSEAEWEYAARAGSVTAYSWGDDIGNDQANCAGCGGQWNGDQTAPVGSFEANQYGLYDMHGNIGEWTQDCYATSYESAPVDGGARAGICEENVVRGGSLINNPRLLRSAFRGNLPSDSRVDSIGFRLAMDR